MKRPISVLLIVSMMTAVFMLSACSKDGGAPASAVTPSDAVRPLTCSDTDAGHEFGEWEPDEATFSFDGLCRICSVCGKTERKSGWMPTEELPPCGVSDEAMELARQMPEAKYNSLPVWKGVHILNFCCAPYYNKYADPEILNTGYVVTESQIKEIADWGFNFLRVPFDFASFFSDETMAEANGMMFANFDKLLTLCARYGIHVSFEMSLYTGYDHSAMRQTLFDDEKMQDAAVEFWGYMSERYKGVSSNLLDFDLLNEPYGIGDGYKSEKQYVEIIKRMIAKIREYDPERLIVAEMTTWSQDPVYELKDLEVVEAFHYYMPGTSENPYEYDISLEAVEQKIKGYADFADKTGMCVFLNEWGAHYTAPADEVIEWFDSLLTALDKYNIGWAMYDYTGYYGFGSSCDCLRGDAKKICVRRDGMPLCVYPDVLEVIQKHLPAERIKVSAQDIIETDKSEKHFHLAPDPVVYDAAGAYYRMNNILPWRGWYINNKEPMGKRDLSWQIEVNRNKERNAKDVRLDMFMLDNLISDSVKKAELQISIGNAKVTLQDGTVIPLDGFNGEYTYKKSFGGSAFTLSDERLSGITMGELDKAVFSMTIELTNSQEVANAF